ncbi:MAG: hypothetical protein GXP55_25960 [Deltaproteobacteria bacterium]|nr:hypothetical protein [Deltaproteobacteria bacterium]
MRVLELTLFLSLAAALPQLAQAQYGGDPETGYTAPAGTQPVAPAPARSAGQASGSDGIRFAMQARFSGVNVVDASRFRDGFGIAVLATPGIRLVGNKLFLGLGVGWFKLSDDGGHAFTLAPTATYDLIQRTNAALHAVVIMNIAKVSRTLSGGRGSSGDLTFGMNFGLGIRALLGESFSIGTEWGFAFTQLNGDPMEPDAAFGFFGALMLESSIGI